MQSITVKNALFNKVAHDKLRHSFSLPKPTDKIKILVVEDNPLIQFAVSSMLEDLRCSFDLAGDGVSAVELARKTNYALILMDIDLPDMTGIEVTKILLFLEDTKDVSIVAMTSHTESHYIEQCYLAGMVGFYNKPKTSEDIKRIIETHITELHKAVAV
jgi:two-component system sensor histidine kinase/response regulator